jgi:hypothetical protein
MKALRILAENTDPNNLWGWDHREGEFILYYRDGAVAAIHFKERTPEIDAAIALFSERWEDRRPQFEAGDNVWLNVSASMMAAMDYIELDEHGEPNHDEWIEKSKFKVIDVRYSYSVVRRYDGKEFCVGNENLIIEDEMDLPRFALFDSMKRLIRASPKG